MTQWKDLPDIAGATPNDDWVSPADLHAARRLPFWSWISDVRKTDPIEIRWRGSSASDSGDCNSWLPAVTPAEWDAVLFDAASGDFYSDATLTWGGFDSTEAASAVTMDALVTSGNVAAGGSTTLGRLVATGEKDQTVDLSALAAGSAPQHIDLQKTSGTLTINSNVDACMKGRQRDLLTLLGTALYCVREGETLEVSRVDTVGLEGAFESGAGTILARPRYENIAYTADRFVEFWDSRDHFSTEGGVAPDAGNF